MAYDLVGQRFGRLVVIELCGSDKGKNRLWRCKCDCGNEKITNTHNLRSGDTQSCGCLRSEIVRDRMITHGHNCNRTRERLYGVWSGMITRTSNPNSTNYKYYGGQGISICKEWLDYEVFRQWALENGYNENAEYGRCTLDRIDYTGNYNPDNCRWVDMSVQSNNTRANHLITYNGETHNLKEWSNILGINYSTFKAKVYKGMTIQEIIEV